MVLLGASFDPRATATESALQWAGSVGGSTGDQGAAIIVDEAGNLYVTGYFTDTADFDPGPETHALTAAGNRDIFVLKLDPEKQFVWARQFSGVDDEEGAALALDHAGNLYVTGYFSGTVDFDPGAAEDTRTANGLRDVFLAKMNKTGDLLGAWQFGGNDVDFGFSVAVDAVNNVYLAGYFESSVDFDPGPGTVLLLSAGVADAFVLKLNSLGELAWARQFGGPANQVVYDLAVDDDGNSYATGYFQDTADFDGGPGTAPMTATNRDAFVAKLDTAGALQWARQFSGAAEEHGNSIAVDANGAVVLTGSFQDTVDFDPGVETFELSAEGSDIFLAKLSPNGEFVWARAFGGSEADEGIAVALDSGGSVYASGYFGGRASFGNGTSFTTFGNWDIFVLKLTAAGNPVWARQLGGSSYDITTTIAYDPRGHLYATGYFYGVLETDGLEPIEANGHEDILILKIEAPNAHSADGRHSTDLDGDSAISLDELLRVVQFYNSLGYHCADIATETEDGFVPGRGSNVSGPPSDADYFPQDWVIDLDELVRSIQFYNSLAYHFCPDDSSEDGYCAGLG